MKQQLSKNGRPKLAKYTITIQSRYVVDVDSDKLEQITEEYENAILPSFIPEENVEYLDGFISYDLKEN